MFAVREHFNPTRPKTRDILEYLAFLSKKLKTPGAVNNYISGARTWVLLNEGDIAPFDSYHVKIIKKGIARVKGHRPLQALPLSVDDIKHIVDSFRKLGRLGLVLTVATLVGYYTYLRQSNLLSSVSEKWPDHTLRGCDVTRVEKALLVRVQSSKTHCDPTSAYTVQLPSLPGSRYCPVKAWDRYRRTTVVAPNGPAFVHLDGRPLLGTTLIRAIRGALTLAKHPTPHMVSLHSLRRGGAQASALAGATLQAVRDVGRWRTNTVYDYTPRRVFSEAARALSTLFGRESPHSFHFGRV